MNRKNVYTALSLLALALVSTVLYLKLFPTESTASIRTINDRVHAATFATGPYTAEIAETIGKEGSPTIESVRFSYARDSKGNTVRERRQKIGIQFHDITIKKDLVATIVSPLVRMKRSVNMHPSRFMDEKRNELDPNQRCTTNQAGAMSPQSTATAVSEEMLGNLFAYKIVTATGTSWRAPSLGCLEVKRRMYFDDNKSFSHLDLVSYSVGEPNPSVFIVDPSFKESTPTQMHEAWVKLRGLDKMPEYAHALENDKKYIARQEAGYQKDKLQ